MRAMLLPGRHATYMSECAAAFWLRNVQRCVGQTSQPGSRAMQLWYGASVKNLNFELQPASTRAVAVAAVAVAIVVVVSAAAGTYLFECTSLLERFDDDVDGSYVQPHTPSARS